MESVERHDRDLLCRLCKVDRGSQEIFAPDASGHGSWPGEAPVDIAMPGPDPSRSALIIVDRLLGYGRLPCVRGHPEPAIIAICGMGPVNFALSDPSQPGVRRL